MREQADRESRRPDAVVARVTWELRAPGGKKKGQAEVGWNVSGRATREAGRLDCALRFGLYSP
jgi:hypothetical protein